MNISVSNLEPGKDKGWSLYKRLRLFCIKNGLVLDEYADRYEIQLDKMFHKEMMQKLYKRGYNFTREVRGAHVVCRFIRSD